MDKNMNYSDLNVKLSKKEKQELQYLNNTSNFANKSINRRSDPMNMTISEFIKKWADVNIKTLIDITNLLTNLDKYRDYFDDIDDFNGYSVSSITEYPGYSYSVQVKYVSLDNGTFNLNPNPVVQTDFKCATVTVVHNTQPAITDMMIISSGL